MSKLRVGLISDLILPKNVTKIFNNSHYSRIDILKYPNYRKTDTPIVGYEQLYKNINFKYIYSCIIDGDLDYAIASEKLLMPLNNNPSKISLLNYIVIVDNKGNYKGTITGNMAVNIYVNEKELPLSPYDIQNMLETYYINHGLCNIGVEEAITICLKRFTEN